MLYIRICILNSYVNFNQNQSCQLQISSANNKCLLSCQSQSSTVLTNIPVKFKLLQLCQSNSSLFQSTICFCYRSSSKFVPKEQLVPVNLFLLSVKQQVRTPRTACACQFVSTIGQAASSHPRTACTYPFDTRRATSSDPRTARVSFFCQPSNQFRSKNSLCFLLFSFSQVTSSNTRAACALCCQYPRSSGQFASQNSLYLSNLLSSLPNESCYLLLC